jgi:hypothetical protein
LAGKCFLKEAILRWSNSNIMSSTVFINIIHGEIT